MKTSKKLMIGCGIVCAIPVVAALAFMIVLGLGMETGHLPSDVAVAKDDIPEVAIRKLRELKIIDADEEIQYLYCGGLFSYAEDGNLFTNRRVISYWTNKIGEIEINSATYPEIISIDFDDLDSWLEDSTIDVETEDDWISLVVSAGEKKDNDFHEKLNKLWQRKRTDANSGKRGP